MRGPSRCLPLEGAGPARSPLPPLQASGVRVRRRPWTCTRPLLRLPWGGGGAFACLPPSGTPPAAATVADRVPGGSLPVRMALQLAPADPTKVRTCPLPVSLVGGSPYSVVVLQEGYATELPDGSTRADGTVSLVLGPQLTLVDTGGPWGRERLLAGLARQGVSPGDIRHVVCTHGHSDHVGNLNLFPGADLIVGTDLSRPDGLYLPNGLRQGLPHPLHAGHLEVLPTPGHAGHDVSLMVWGTSMGHVLVAGDLFECEDDEGQWQPLSQDPVRQEASRAYALRIADIIVPGHGAPFRVLREGTGRPGPQEGMDEACRLPLCPGEPKSH